MTQQEKLFEDIKPLVNSQYWPSLQKLIDTFIDEKRQSLEKVSKWDDVLRLRGNIESLREISELDQAIKKFDENTNPQSRGRETQLYMTKP